MNLTVESGDDGGDELLEFWFKEDTMVSFSSNGTGGSEGSARVAHENKTGNIL